MAIYMARVDTIHPGWVMSGARQVKVYADVTRYAGRRQEMGGGQAIGVAGEYSESRASVLVVIGLRRHSGRS